MADRERLPSRVPDGPSRWGGGLGPGLLRPGPQPLRHTPGLAGDHRGSHGREALTGRRPDLGGEVPGPRRTDPRGRLRDGSGRRTADAVRQPSRRGGARLHTRGMARPAGHLDRAAARGRPRGRPGASRPEQRERRGLGHRVPPDRQRRSGRLGPRPRDADPRSRRRSGSVARRDHRRHRRARGARDAAPPQRGPRAPRRGADQRAPRSERADVARDRRATSYGARAADVAGPLPEPRREHAGDRLRLGDPPGRAPAPSQLRQPAGQGDPRVRPRGVGAVRSRPSARPGERRRSGRSQRADGRAVPNGVPVPGERRERRLGARSRHPDQSDRRRRPRLVPGDDARHHRSQGGGAEGRSRRGPVPYPDRARPGRRLHVRPRLRGAGRRSSSGHHLPEPPGRRPRPLPRRALGRGSDGVVRDGPSRRSRARHRERPAHLEDGRPVVDPLPDDPLRRRGDLAAGHRRHGGT